MPTLNRLSVRTKTLKWAFVLYGILSLGSMATMSIGASILFLALILNWDWSSLSTEWAKPRSKIYLLLSLTLALTCLLSLVFAKLFPLGYAGKTVSIHFGMDLAKLWYLPWPFLLAM